METPATSSMPDLTDDAARAAWLSGDSPQAPAGKTEDSAPSEPVEQAASTDASSKPASEPGTPAKERRKGEESRIPELLQDRAEERRLRLDAQARADDLERQLHALRQPKPDGKTPDSSTAAKQAEWKRYAEMPDAPKESDEAFPLYGDYVAAMALFIADKRFEERDATAKSESQVQQQRERRQASVNAAQTRVKTYLEANPGALDKINPTLKEIPALSALSPAEIAELRKPQYGNALAASFLVDQITDSPNPVELMLYFSEKGDGEAHWGRLLHASPEQIIREIGRLEARFERGATSPPIRSPKTISTAPEPAETLGRRPAASPDAAEAALMSGDFSSYADEQNRRDWLRHNP